MMEVSEKYKKIKKYSYDNYLEDESGLKGQANSIFFPECAEELEYALETALAAGERIVLQGSRTGITGAAVPMGDTDLVVSFERMNHILGLRRDTDSFYITVQPGVTLESLNKSLSMKKISFQYKSAETQKAFHAFKDSAQLFFPPAPTEKTATIAGIVSTAAAGCNVHYYGRTNKYIQMLTVFFPHTRERWAIPRGAYILKNGIWNLPNGKILAVEMLIGKRGHPFVPFEGMDLLDLFIGSEGMLGVIEQIELRLIEIPKNRWGIFSFFMDFDSTLSFAERMIAFDHANPRVVSVLEFCDQRSISYAQSFIKESSGLQKLPEIPKNSCASIYMELIFEEEAFQNDILIQVLDMLEECGVREEATWAGSEDQEIVLFRDFRHAIPEAINARIGENRLRDQTLHKLSSDFSVPQVCISDLAHMYRQDIEKSGVDAAMFGHVFESHLHINFIPKDAHEKQIAESLLKKWSVYVAETGGTIINEHGVGKLKKEIAKTGLPHETLLAMIQIKRAFDPDGFLNPTNMFDDNIMNI